MSNNSKPDAAVDREKLTKSEALALRRQWEEERKEKKREKKERRKAKKRAKEERRKDRKRRERSDSEADSSESEEERSNARPAATLDEDEPGRSGPAAASDEDEHGNSGPAAASDEDEHSNSGPAVTLDEDKRGNSGPAATLDEEVEFKQEPRDESGDEADGSSEQPTSHAAAPSSDEERRASVPRSAMVELLEPAYAGSALEHDATFADIAEWCFGGSRSAKNAVRRLGFGLRYRSSAMAHDAAAVMLEAHAVDALMRMLLVSASKDVGTQDNSVVVFVMENVCVYRNLRKHYQHVFTGKSEASKAAPRGWRNLRNSRAMRAIVHSCVSRICAVQAASPASTSASAEFASELERCIEQSKRSSDVARPSDHERSLGISLVNGDKKQVAADIARLIALKNEASVVSILKHHDYHDGRVRHRVLGVLRAAHQYLGGRRCPAVHTIAHMAAVSAMQEDDVAFGAAATDRFDRPPLDDPNVLELYASAPGDRMLRLFRTAAK
jgi:hypothetical protein